MVWSHPPDRMISIDLTKRWQFYGGVGIILGSHHVVMAQIKMFFMLQEISAMHAILRSTISSYPA
jgi:hypothetical protein